MVIIIPARLQHVVLKAKVNNLYLIIAQLEGVIKPKERKSQSFEKGLKSESTSVNYIFVFLLIFH